MGSDNSQNVMYRSIMAKGPIYAYCHTFLCAAEEMSCLTSHHSADSLQLSGLAVTILHS